MLFRSLHLSVSGMDEIEVCDFCYLNRSGLTRTEKKLGNALLGVKRKTVKYTRCTCTAPTEAKATFVKPTASKPRKVVTGWVNVQTGEWLTDKEAVVRLRAV